MLPLSCQPGTAMTPPSERERSDFILDINFALVYPFEVYNSIEKSLVDCKPTGAMYLNSCHRFYGFADPYKP